jgi:WD40 repeat protein
MAQSDVFLSYRRKDVDFVKKVDQALRATGREVWVDWEDIPPGVEGFGDEIQRGIEGASAFIAILSPAYLESEYCIMELREALKLKKRIIPIVYEKFEPKPPPEGIGHINWVYFTPHAGQENTFEVSFPKVVQALEADYEHSREHTRILLRAIDWDKGQKNNSYLLKGAEIEKAERWQMNAASKDPTPTALQTEYVIISRKQQRKQQQQITAVISVLMVLAVIAGIVAIFQAKAARLNEDIAHSDKLASIALQNGSEDLDVALALEAARSKNASIEVFKALAKVAYPPGAIRYLHTPTDDENYEKFFFPAVSPDGRYIVLQNRLIDLATDSTVLEFKDTPGIILCGIYTPDGKQVILAGDDEGVNDPSKNPVFLGLYDATSGELVRKFDTGIGISNIQLSNDGSTLIAYQPDGKVKWWDVAAGKQLKEFTAGEETIFSKDLKWMANLNQAADGKGLELVILDANTLDNHVTVPISTQETYGVIRFSSDSKVIGVATGKKLTSYNVQDGSERSTYTDSSSNILSFHYSPDGTTLVAATSDYGVILWKRSVNGQPGGIITKQTIHQDSVIAAEYVAGGERIVSMDVKGVVAVWDVYPGNMENHLIDTEIPRAVTPDGKLVITEISDDTNTVIHIRDAESLKEVSQVTIPGRPGKGGHVSFITSYYLAEGIENGLLAYETYTSVEVGTITSQSTNVVSLKDGRIVQSWDMYATAKFSPDGKELVAFVDQKFQILDIASGKKVREFELPLGKFTINTNNEFELSPDGSQILFSYVPNDPNTGNTQPATTVLMDTTSGKTLVTFAAKSAIFTPDSAQFVTISSPADSGEKLQLTIYDSKSRKVIRELSITAPGESDVQVDPSGKYVFTAYGGGGGFGMDTTPSGIIYRHSYQLAGFIGQWDFTTSNLLWEFPVASQDVVFSPDGTRIFTGAEDFRVWRMDSAAQLIAWACSNRYVPDFTPEQRDFFGIKNEVSVCKTQ